MLFVPCCKGFKNSHACPALSFTQHILSVPSPSPLTGPLITFIEHLLCVRPFLSALIGWISDNTESDCQTQNTITRDFTQNQTVLLIIHRIPVLTRHRWSPKPPNLLPSLPSHVGCILVQIEHTESLRKPCRVSLTHRNYFIHETSPFYTLMVT